MTCAARTSTVSDDADVPAPWASTMPGPLEAAVKVMPVLGPGVGVGVAVGAGVRVGDGDGDGSDGEPPPPPPPPQATAAAAVSRASAIRRRGPRRPTLAAPAP